MNRQIHKLRNSQKLRIKKRKADYEKNLKKYMDGIFSDNSQTIKDRNLKYEEGLQSINEFKKNIEGDNFVELDFRHPISNIEDVVDNLIEKITKS